MYNQFPKELADKIAIETITNDPNLIQLKEVIFVCFDHENYKLYSELIKTEKDEKQS